MAIGPYPYAIFPDPAFAGAAQVTTYTDYGGRYAGPGVPSSGNEGDLVPYTEGDPTADTKLDLKLFRAGGLYEGAEWGWKQSTDSGTDPTGEYRGAPDKRYMHDNHDPYDDGLNGYGTCALVSRAYNRVLLFRVNSGSTAFTVRHRDLGASDPTAWTNLTFTPERMGTADAAKIVGCELDDGALRLLVSYGTVTASDFDVYSSTDGGLTWSRVARDVLQTWTSLGTQRLDCARMVASGDWLRVCFVDASPDVQTLVSSDRGASWALVSAGGIPGSTDSVAGNGYTLEPYAVALIGVGDRSGTCLLFVKVTSSTANLKSYSAARDEDWSEMTSYQVLTSATNVKRLVGARDSRFAYVVRQEDDGAAGSYWRGFYGRLDDVLTTSIWKSMGGTDMPGLNGSQKYHPANSVMVAAGPALLWYHGLANPDSGGGAVAGTGVVSLVGWSRQPVVGPTSSSMWDDLWTTLYGQAAGPSDASPDTRWTRAIAGAASSAWSADRTRAQAPAGASVYWERNLGVAPTTKWADASAFDFAARGTLGGSVTADWLAARFVAGSATAGNTTDVSVRLAGSTVVVYDNVAAATLETIGGFALTTAWYQFRWSQRKVSSAYNGQLAYSLLGDRGWTRGGTHALTAGAGPLTQAELVRFGVLTGPGSAVTSDWRSFAVAGTTDYLQYNFSNPRDVRGLACDPGATYVLNGVYARWGGGGAFETDTHTANTANQYGAEALFTDSPSMGFRSANKSSNQLVFDAAQGNGTTNVRFVHDAIALFATNFRRVRLQYNATDAWGSPSVDTTISSDVHTGLTVSGVDGDVVLLASSPAGVTEGELVGSYLVVDGGGSDGNSARIAGHLGRRVVLGGVNAADKGFAAGATVAVHADHFVENFGARRVYRFMRLSWANAAAVSTADSDFRVGRIVPGTTYGFPVSLDWAHTDSEEGNVTVVTLKGGLRVAFQEGAARRSLSALLPGDVSLARVALRGMVRDVLRYATRPFAVVLDQARPIQTSLYCRWVGPTDLDQQAWYVAASGEWRQAGDLAVKVLEEEV